MPRATSRVMSTHIKDLLKKETKSIMAHEGTAFKAQKR